MNTVKNIFKITSISTALFLLLLFFTPRLSSPVITQDLTPKPTNNSQPKPQQAQTNQTNTPKQNLNAIGRSSEFTQIIKFQDKASKLTFLKDNSLKESDLTPLNKLNAYSIHTKSLLATSGVQTFTSQHYTAFLAPTDPIQASQWHLNNTDTKTAWNHQIGSPNVTVAVLDTGFGLGVSDLSSAWKINTSEYGPTSVEGPAPNCTSQFLDINKRCNNIDDDNDGYTDNYMGWNFVNDNNNVAAGQLAPNSSAAYHGTAVSSLIAGRANNGIGGSGMSWESKVLPVQVLDDNGDGDTVSVALGIRYAVDQGVDIINMSLGTNSDDPLVSEQIDYATQNGVIVIAASGNDGCDCVSYPARYPSVIAVGATNVSNGLAGFSSYGSSLDIVAPGVNLCSVIWANSATTGLNTCGLNGTSFSAPLVAGAVALLLSQNPTLTPTQATNALTSTATKLIPMNGANFTKYYGYGLLNTLSALNDVSATSSYGSPISASRISLSQLDKVLDGYEYDKFNSSCTSYTNDVACTTRAINRQTNQIVTITPNFTPVGTRSLQQDIYNANLISGTWIIQNYLTTATGIQSMAREKIITITN